MALKLNLEFFKNTLTFLISTSQILLNLLSNIEKGIPNG